MPACAGAVSHAAEEDEDEMGASHGRDVSDDENDPEQERLRGIALRSGVSGATSHAPAGAHRLSQTFSSRPSPSAHGGVRAPAKALAE